MKNLFKVYTDNESMSLEDRIRNSKEELKENNRLFYYGRMIEEINRTRIKINYYKLADYYLKFFKLKNDYELELYKEKEKNTSLKNEFKAFKRELYEYKKNVVTAITSIYNSTTNNCSKILMFNQLLKIYFEERDEKLYPILLNYSFEIRNIIEKSKKNPKNKKSIKEIDRIKNLINSL